MLFFKFLKYYLHSIELSAILFKRTLLKHQVRSALLAAERKRKGRNHLVVPVSPDKGLQWVIDNIVCPIRTEYYGKENYCEG